MVFYDRTLNKNVNFARHALSIDEARDHFNECNGVNRGSGRAPNHNGLNNCGSREITRISEAATKKTSSRLSDVSLKWILDAAVAVGLKYDPSFLRLYPDPTGPQHDETRSSMFKYAKKSIRPLRNDYPLHPSVLERLQAGKVLNYDRYEDYRPENLRDHNEAKNFYPQKVEPGGTASTPKQGG